VRAPRTLPGGNQARFGKIASAGGHARSLHDGNDVVCPQLATTEFALQPCAQVRI
jgi:hypothetical protein